MDRFIEFALVAARKRWPSRLVASIRGRTGTHCHGDRHRDRRLQRIANAVHTTDERGPRRLSPFTIPLFWPTAAGHVSIAHGFRGPIGAPVTACAAGAQPSAMQRG